MGIISINLVDGCVGWTKLNTDGSCIEGKCAGDGVLRDCLGNAIFAMTFKLGSGYNDFAEAASLFYCLQFSVANYFYPNIIELDSQFLVDCLKEEINPPWKLIYIIRRSLCLICPNTFI